MVFDVITIFPDFFRGILDYGLLKRASERGKIQIRVHNLRDFTDDPHRTVDDRPFGGGPGMVFKPEPLFRAVEAIQRDKDGGSPPRVVLLTPQGRLFNQSAAADLSRGSHIVLISSRYEGVDERVATHLATDEFSIGDYVLSGGELPAAVIMETVTRLLPGTIGNEESIQAESFAGANSETDSPMLLDFPQYTRPAEFRGLKVPDILLSGDHEAIAGWRRRQAQLRTSRRRPDLISGAVKESNIINQG